MTNEPTTGDLIRAARLARGKKLHGTLTTYRSDVAAKISPAEMYTQTDLAADAGCAASQISSWERGEKKPTVDSLIKLAAALGVPVADLLPSVVARP